MRAGLVQIGEKIIVLGGSDKNSENDLDGK